MPVALAEFHTLDNPVHQGTIEKACEGSPARFPGVPLVPQRPRAARHSRRISLCGPGGSGLWFWILLVYLLEDLPSKYIGNGGAHTHCTTVNPLSVTGGDPTRRQVPHSVHLGVSTLVCVLTPREKYPSHPPPLRRCVITQRTQRVRVHDRTHGMSVFTEIPDSVGEQMSHQQGELTHTCFAGWGVPHIARKSLPENRKIPTIKKSAPFPTLKSQRKGKITQKGKGKGEKKRVSNKSDK